MEEEQEEKKEVWSKEKEEEEEKEKEKEEEEKEEEEKVKGVKEKVEENKVIRTRRHSPRVTLTLQVKEERETSPEDSRKATRKVNPKFFGGAGGNWKANWRGGGEVTKNRMCASHGKGNTFIDWYNKGDGLVFFLFNELHPYSVLLLKIRCRYTVYFVYTTGLTSQLIYKISFWGLLDVQSQGC